MKTYLSFGGGVNSVAMYLHCLDIGMKFEAIYVDHGGDWPETAEYLEYFTGRGYPVTVIKPEVHYTGATYNDLYHYCIDKGVVPSVRSRWCTRDFKVRPIMEHIEKPCFMLIGIDAGEEHRARLATTAGVENRWPLIEAGIDRDGCKRLIERHGLEIPQKSGCFFCPFQRVGQWRKLRRKHPDLFCKVQKIERAVAEKQRRRGKKPYYIRGDGPIEQLINDKQLALPGTDAGYPPCNCGL